MKNNQKNKTENKAKNSGSKNCGNKNCGNHEYKHGGNND